MRLVDGEVAAADAGPGDPLPVAEVSIFAVVSSMEFGVGQKVTAVVGILVQALLSWSPMLPHNQRTKPELGGRHVYSILSRSVNFKKTISASDLRATYSRNTLTQRAAPTV